MGRIIRRAKKLTSQGAAPVEEEAASTIFATSVTETPPRLAEKILSTRTSLEGERKQITVLFADVVGFTSLSEKLDPEEVRDLISPALDIMAEEIHDYEGTIAQFMGDGLMALFGAPLAHEDDPHRALYAALAMQARLEEYGQRRRGIQLRMRVGINTGLVIVGRIGDDLTMEYSALGDTVNLASRMESSAEPGTVQISESTYRLTEGYFDFSDLGEIEVRGKEQPIHAYRVTSALPTRSRISASLSRGLSPFVGREKEMDQLTDRYAQIKQSHGQVVSMVGEPGVGKSRLLLQFRESLPPEEYTYLEGGCIHYGEAIPYLPVLGILRNYFEIGEGEEETTSKQKLDRRLASLNGQLDHILPPLQELLSMEVDDQTYLSLEPAQRRERVFEAVRYLLIVESQQKPLVLAIEDLHWIDKTSEEFLSYFIEGLGNAMILLILLHRLEYTAAWASKTYYRQILVDQLPEEPSMELVEAILSEGEVSPEISDFIVQKTAGNPLFIEELTRGLLEAGSILKDNEHYVLSTGPADIQVPDTIQGIMASRLDRLTDDLKETMQVASVIGREFPLRLLEEVKGLSKPLKPALMQLQSLEFIYEKTFFPEPEYIFKHALTQEVAYNSLLLKHRKEIHKKSGRAIEELHPDSLEDFYETLAHHYSRSGDTEKALHYLKLSGDKAAHDYSNWESMRFYKEAIQILDAQPETAESKREKLEFYLSITDTLPFLNFPEGSIETFEAAERLAEELGDTESKAKAYGWLSRYYVYKGNMPLAFEYSGKCFTAAERVGDINSMAEVATNICAVRFFACRFMEVVDISRRVIRLLEEQHREKDLFMGGWSVFSYLSAYCGSSLWFMGEFEEGKAQLVRGFENALEINDRMGMAWVEIMQCNVTLWSGDVSLVDHARNAIQCFEEIGVEILLGFAWSFMGAGHYLLGECETARDHAEKGLKLSREYGMVVTVPFSLWISAFVYLALGDLESARECGEEGLRLSQGYGTRLYDGVLLAILGRIVGEADSSMLEVAEEYIRQGIAMGDELQMMIVSAIGHLFLGEVYSLVGRMKEAMENLEKAEQVCQEMEVGPSSYWLSRTREALARLG